MALVQRRFDDCQKILDAAAKLDDGKYAYFKSYLRGKYKISTGNLAEATRELEAAREAKGDYAPTLVLLAQAYLRGSTQALDRSNDAARVLLDAIRANPDNQELYQMLIGLLLQKNQAADAQQLLAQLMERHPDSVIGRIIQVQLLMMDQTKPDRQAQALAMIQQIKKDAPDNLELQWLEFRAHLRAVRSRRDELGEARKGQ